MSAVVLVLPAVPVIPIVGPLPPLEQDVAETGDAGALLAEPPDPGGRLGCPDVEVGDVCGARVGVEVGVRLQADTVHEELIRLIQGAFEVARPCHAHVVPLGGEQPRERERVGPEPFDQHVHARTIAFSNAVSRT